jgi:hypothetical protein
MSNIDVSRLRKVQAQTGAVSIYAVPATPEWADWRDADAVVHHGTCIARGAGLAQYVMAEGHPDYAERSAAAEADIADYYRRLDTSTTTRQQDLREEEAIRMRHLGIPATTYRALHSVGISTRL